MPTRMGTESCQRAVDLVPGARIDDDVVDANQGAGLPVPDADAQCDQSPPGAALEPVHGVEVDPVGQLPSASAPRAEVPRLAYVGLGEARIEHFDAHVGVGVRRLLRVREPELRVALV